MTDQETVDALIAVAKTIGHGGVPAYMQTEDFTAGVFDLILFNSRDKGRIFSLLEQVCARYSCAPKDATFMTGYTYLLNQMARSTDTTEMPRGMRQIISEHPTKTKSLQEWYKISG